MFIFWGKKLVTHKLGFAADFCPMCRKVQSFLLKRIGLAGHVYYISSGDGELVGFERTCMRCETSLSTEPERYASIEKRPLALPELVKRTFPDVEGYYRERLELEKKVLVAPNSLSSAEREAFISLPFQLLSPKVEKRFASTHIDGRLALGILGALLALVLGPLITLTLFGEGNEGVALLISFLLGAGVVIWQSIESGKAFMRNKILPALVLALHPLKPTKSELEKVIHSLRMQQQRIGKKLSADFVLEQLSNRP